MRYAFAVLALFTLACAGPGTVRLDRAGFALDVMDGTVTGDNDRGSEGDHDIEWGLSSQSISWSPIDGQEPLENEVELLWTAMSALMEADDSLEMPPKPTFVPGTVAGQPSLGFEANVSGATIVSTTWRCPEAGVQVTVNSAGLGGVVARHEASLASAVCKDTPAARVQGPRGYRFVGGEAWSLTDEDPGEQRLEWTRNDGVAVVTAFPQGSLLVDADLCKATLGMVVSVLELDPDPGLSAYRETKTRCQQDLGGSWQDGSGDVRVRLVHEGCGGDGYLSMCLVERADLSLDEVCNGVVVCE